MGFKIWFFFPRSQYYSNCKPLNAKNRVTVPCGGSNSITTFNTLIKNIDISIAEWYSDNQKIVGFFERFYMDSYFNELIGKKDVKLEEWYANGIRAINFFDNFYRSYYRTKESQYTLVTDDFLISLAVALLGDTTTNSKYALKTGVHLLKSSTSYPGLLEHSKEIRQAKTKINSNNDEYIELLILTTKDKNEADSFLDGKNLSLHCRTRLSDKHAEDTLVSSFITEIDFEKRIGMIEHLTFVASKRCQKTLIKEFNASVYGRCPANTKICLLIRHTRLHACVIHIQNYHSECMCMEGRRVYRLAA